MSATNRGTVRQPHDFYATPIDVVENLLHKFDLNKYGDKVLEPSAGNGNIIKSIHNMNIDKNITALELREEEMDHLSDISDNVIIDDFLEHDFNNEKFDIIIGNPPYSLAKKFVEKSLTLLDDNGGVLIFLLRTAFLESKSRYEFWQQNPLSNLYTLSKRPSFTGHGTDATSYSWFMWDKSTDKQIIKII